jgi:hypothetical protein
MKGWMNTEIRENNKDWERFKVQKGAHVLG